MYTVSTHPTQPIIIVTQQRSLCSRITAFFLTMVCTYIMLSTIVSVAVFMSASDDSLRVFMERVESAAEDLAAGKVGPAFEQVTRVFVIHAEPVPAPIVTFIPRAVAIVSLIGLVCSLIGCALYVAYLNHPEFQAMVDTALATASQYAAQLYTELSVFAANLYQQIVTFDYQGMWNDFVAFCMNVYAEIKSYFVSEEGYMVDGEVMEMVEADVENQVSVITTPETTPEVVAEEVVSEVAAEVVSEESDPTILIAAL